jgi:hypothetical protein
MKKETEIELVNINNKHILQTFSNLIKRKPETIYTTYYFHMAASKKNVVLAYNYIDRLELFQYNESQQRVIPILIIGSNKDQSENKNFDDYISYYTDVDCDSQYIYALFQGKKKDQMTNSTIEVYTMEGKPVTKIILDRYIESFALDLHRNKIYGYNPYQSFDYVYIYQNNLNENSEKDLLSQ